MSEFKSFNQWMVDQGFNAVRHANCCRIAYEAAQQSMQAKIDDSENTRAVLYRENIDLREKNTELLKRVEEVCQSIHQFFDDQVGTPTQREYCNFIAEIKQALRGGHESN